MSAPPYDREATTARIVDFALHLAQATPDDTPDEIAVMGALAYLSAVARTDPVLTLRAAAALARVVAELSDLPSSAPPPTH